MPWPGMEPRSVKYLILQRKPDENRNVCVCKRFCWRVRLNYGHQYHHNSASCTKEKKSLTKCSIVFFFSSRCLSRSERIYYDCFAFCVSICAITLCTLGLHTDINCWPSSKACAYGTLCRWHWKKKREKLLQRKKNQDASRKPVKSSDRAIWLMHICTGIDFVFFSFPVLCFLNCWTRQEKVLNIKNNIFTHGPITHQVIK